MCVDTSQNVRPFIIFASFECSKSSDKIIIFHHQRFLAVLFSGSFQMGVQGWGIQGDQQRDPQTTDQ